MTHDEFARVTKDLIRNGKLIEAGFLGLKYSGISPLAPPIQVADMRLAFFAGAQHVFTSVLLMLEPGDTPTPNDLTRMSQIHDELEAFFAEMKVRNPEGTA